VAEGRERALFVVAGETPALRRQTPVGFADTPFGKGALKRIFAASCKTKTASLRAKRSNPEKCASKKHWIASSLRSSQ
jgi:hypothetical protein